MVLEKVFVLLVPETFSQVPEEFFFCKVIVIAPLPSLIKVQSPLYAVRLIPELTSDNTDDSLGWMEDSSKESAAKTVVEKVNNRVKSKTIFFIIIIVAPFYKKKGCCLILRD